MYLLIGEAKHGTVRATVFAPAVLTTATLVGFILPPQALATSADGAVDREGFDYSMRSAVVELPCLGRDNHSTGKASPW
jgi:hypothetical protein